MHCFIMWLYATDLVDMNHMGSILLHTFPVADSRKLTLDLRTSLDNDVIHEIIRRYVLATIVYTTVTL